MCAAAGGATRLALGMAEALAAHADRIAATFAADRGLMLAEAAVFALAERMPRPEAQALVAEAVRAIGRGTLGEALAARVPEIDWAAALDPSRLTGDAPALADRLRTVVTVGQG
jgi:3-carboxy-cis,cis-muconate cycloisomerase